MYSIAYIFTLEINNKLKQSNQLSMLQKKKEFRNDTKIEKTKKTFNITAGITLIIYRWEVHSTTNYHPLDKWTTQDCGPHKISPNILRKVREKTAVT